MTPFYTVLLLALSIMTGCGAVCVFLIFQQRKLKGEIDLLNIIFQDFLSIQEHNLKNLKAEIRSQDAGFPRAERSAFLPDKGMEGDSPTPTPDESNVYQEPKDMTWKKKQIWDLADSGLDIEEIARRAQIPSGQVDVILNMRHLGEGGDR
jgi:hypothetical protein